MTKQTSHYYVRSTPCASRVIITTLLGALWTTTTLASAQNINLADPQGAAIANITGYHPNSYPTSLLTPVGDATGDGIDDVLIGSPLHMVSGQLKGRGYLATGRAGFSNLDLLSIEASNARGMIAYSSAAGTSVAGMWVSGVGDFNGDGSQDYILGGDSQVAYLVYGSPSLSNLNLATFDTSNVRGFKITGTQNIAAGVGDLNDDGYDDIALAHWYYSVGFNSDCGKVFVIYGRPATGNISLSTFTSSSSNGFTITGGSGDMAGKTLSAAGDFNNDGVDDLLLQGKFAFRMQPTGQATSSCYMVVKGCSDGLQDIDLGQEPYYHLPENCFAVLGFINETLSVMGASAPSTPRDFNGDGFSDILVVDRSADPDGATNAGSAYVVYGRDDQTTNVSISSLASPSSNGLRIDGITGEQIGWGWSWAGDVNNDNLADVIFAARDVSHNNLERSGSTYCVYGKTTATATIDLASNFVFGPDGFRVDGARANPPLSPVISPAGDVNGDGYDDFLIGSSMDPSTGNPVGDAYLIFGHPAPAGIADWMRW